MAGCSQSFSPQALPEGVEGSVEEQLIAVGTLLLRTLLRPDVRSVEAMVMADKKNQASLSKLHYEAGPAHVIAQVEAFLHQLHAKSLLNVPDPHQSARLFSALFKGSDLLMIARFDEAQSRERQRNRILLSVGRRHVHRRTRRHSGGAIAGVISACIPDCVLIAT
ncbi:TetR/AcrR family transcriptional regulator C-terminal domain-containing protein [Klebsiella variicola]|uniref:TetR/AcrR family transcriptional regulator C-terminal domain-containing protein n=1 Tax=Klebsiella variicola TaxID=244366 RepID=UPI002948BA75|nr:TetR/AcrR family transcriptional regulator C-terminal domain-containing protein [Klebsiella variicola]